MIGEKILVVDDEKIIRDTFCVAFEDYRVITAKDAEEALGILKKPHAIDLVVLDVVMPGMNGLALLKEIKTMSPPVKVIILTGCNSKDVVVEALREHADEYMDKPFDVEAMKQMFKKLLSSTRRTAGGRYQEDTNSKIAYARHFIELNCHKPLTLEDVAGQVYLSAKYFSRIFKEKTGKSFNQYRLDAKVEKAKKLMETSGLTINQIAYQIGYESPESFIKTFKKLTGKTPAAYRKRTTKNK